MVNPFDLRGPEFLLFYGCLGAAVTVLVFLMRRAGERGNPPHPLSDYLDIAFLRGGAGEAIGVAILTLVDRGVLTLSGEDRSWPGGRIWPGACRSPRSGRSSREPPFDEGAGADRRRPPDRDGDRGLRADPGASGSAASPDQKAVRTRLWIAAGGALAAVAAIKIAIAISRGRSNVGFLVLLGFVFLIATFVATHPRRTPAGNALVGDLRTLFGGLKDRASRCARRAAAPTWPCWWRCSASAPRCRSTPRRRGSSPRAAPRTAA